MPTFFDRYSRSEVTADRIAEFVGDWHALDDTEERSLAAYLGLTDEEYDVLLMDTDALPQILSARKTGRRLRDVMADYLAELQRRAQPEDRTSTYALGHWLKGPAH